jgi:hypothetical protein
MGIGPHNKPSGDKRRFQMSVRSQLSRTLVAMAGALALSTVTIGAAVGPAQANANPIGVNLNA